MWRRFARFLAKFSTLFVSLVVALIDPSMVLAQEGHRGESVDVRFLNQREEVAIVDGWSDEGIRLKLEGISSSIYFSWSQLEPQCSKRLQRKFLGKGKTSRLGDRVPGYRVIDRKGIDFFPVPHIEIVEGISVPSSDPAVIRLKTGSRVRIFSRKDLVYIRQVSLDRSEVLTESERVGEVVNRVRPGDEKGWDEVGRELMQMGMKDRAIDAFRRAEVLRRPDLPEGKLYRDLIRIRRSLRLDQLKTEILRAQDFFLEQEFPSVLEILKVVGKAVKDYQVRSEIQRTGKEIRIWWRSSREEQIVVEWGRVIDSLIRSKVADRSITLTDAEAYLRTHLMSDTDRLIRLRFGFVKEDPDPVDLWEERSVADVRKHSFGEGSWVRVRPDLGNPQEWWKNADDSFRVAYLKGLSIESVYRVLWTGKKHCSHCGGKGVVFATGAQGSVCPTCRGLKIEKILFYR